MAELRSREEPLPTVPPAWRARGSVRAGETEPVSIAEAEAEEEASRAELSAREMVTSQSRCATGAAAAAYLIAECAATAGTMAGPSAPGARALSEDPGPANAHTGTDAGTCTGNGTGTGTGIAIPLPASSVLPPAETPATARKDDSCRRAVLLLLLPLLLLPLLMSAVVRGRGSPETPGETFRRPDPHTAEPFIAGA
jgi:hypothetical protein